MEVGIIKKTPKYLYYRFSHLLDGDLILRLHKEKHRHAIKHLQTRDLSHILFRCEIGEELRRSIPIPLGRYGVYNGIDCLRYLGARHT